MLSVRAGLIVGPHDYSDRFTYWPRRVAEGGDVLAPGDEVKSPIFVAGWTTWEHRVGVHVVRTGQQVHREARIVLVSRRAQRRRHLASDGNILPTVGQENVRRLPVHDCQ